MSAFEEMVIKELSELNASFKGLDEAIRGNGRPGLNQRVDRLEAFKQKHLYKHSAPGKFMKAVIQGLVISLVSSAVGGLIVYLF